MALLLYFLQRMVYVVWLVWWRG